MAKSIAETEKAIFSNIKSELKTLKSQSEKLETVINNGTVKDEDFPAALATLREIKRDIKQLEKLEGKNDDADDVHLANRVLRSLTRAGFVNFRTTNKGSYLPPTADKTTLE